MATTQAARHPEIKESSSSKQPPSRHQKERHLQNEGYCQRPTKKHEQMKNDHKYQTRK